MHARPTPIVPIEKLEQDAHLADLADQAQRHDCPEGCGDLFTYCDACARTRDTAERAHARLDAALSQIPERHIRPGAVAERRWERDRDAAA